MKKNYRSGFIALISVLIISWMLLLAVVSLGQKAISGRFLLLDAERKARSERLAEACVEFSRIQIVNNPSYSPSPIDIKISDSDSCKIVSVMPGIGELRGIKSCANVSDSITNLETEINGKTGEIVSQRELPTLNVCI
jgi:hypothetical protein